MKFAIIGAGNGGQAIAGYLSMNGHSVNVYDRDPHKIAILSSLGSVSLTGALTGSGKLSLCTTDLATAVKDVDIVMVTTVANAHYQIATQLSPFLSNEQIIILNPGRTGGALSFRSGLEHVGCRKHVYIAEAQTLVYACRSTNIGFVNIIGVKDNVLLSALPATDTSIILDAIRSVYPCYVATDNILHTGLENIGAIFHPSIILFNAATIERGNEFYFYRDMTPHIAGFIEQLDQERLNLGTAYGIKLKGVSEWISFAYQDTLGTTLCEKMKNNPAYYDILAPSSIYTRQLIEDIPTGIVPMIELGEVAGLPMTLFKSVAHISSTLLDIDFSAQGRTLKKLGLDNLSKDEILDYIR